MADVNAGIDACAGALHINYLGVLYVLPADRNKWNDVTLFCFLKPFVGPFVPVVVPLLYTFP